jgi:hypothetical protein
MREFGRVYQTGPDQRGRENSTMKPPLSSLIRFE